MVEIVPPSEPENKISRMAVNSDGARLESLALGGYQLITSVTRGDGKEASTHLCTPIFGPDTRNLYGLSQHGAMRKSKCNVIAKEPDHVILSHYIKEGTYPLGMNVRQEFVLKDGLFRLITIHTNHGSETAPVLSAEHLYWNTPQGWEGLKVNGKDATTLVKSDTAIPWQEENVIELPGQKPIHVSQHGLPYAMFWAYKKEGGEGQEDTFDKNYVCIEPAEGYPDTFGSPETMIKPGDSRTTEIVISI